MWQGSGSVQCSSAWLSRAGEDFGVHKVNQDSALAVGSYSIGDALFGVFDGHGPHGEYVLSACRQTIYKFTQDLDFAKHEWRTAQLDLKSLSCPQVTW